jgi:hypothetical protein
LRDTSGVLAAVIEKLSELSITFTIIDHNGQDESCCLLLVACDGILVAGCL